MPRTLLTVQTSGRLTQLDDPTANAADMANGNSWDNSSHRVIGIINNGSGGVLTTTVTIPGQVEEEQIPPKTYTTADGGETVIGPYPARYDNNDEDNSISKALYIDWSTDTSVTVKVIRVPETSEDI